MRVLMEFRIEAEDLDVRTPAEGEDWVQFTTDLAQRLLSLALATVRSWPTGGYADRPAEPPGLKVFVTKVEVQ